MLLSVLITREPCFDLDLANENTYVSGNPLKPRIDAMMCYGQSENETLQKMR
jgi:hypothetical protein